MSLFRAIIIWLFGTWVILALYMILWSMPGVNTDNLPIFWNIGWGLWTVVIGTIYLESDS